MGKNFTSVFAVCLAISAIPLACGGDDDDGGDGSTGGKGGSAGSTSTGGKGGTAGSTSTGGKGGTAGSTSTGGKGGTAGTAGTAGMGGAEGGMGGAEGGMGGEGGVVEPPQSLCEQVCEGPSGTCQATCVTSWCADLYSTPTCEPLIDALVTCFAADDAAASWVCTQGVPQYGGSACDDQLYAAYDAGCV